MPVEDDSALLPKPPPPRPAARGAAIDMAMRRFDGIEEPAAKPAPARSSWTRTPQFGLLVTASLVAVIGIPTALIVIQNSDFCGRQSTPAVHQQVRPAVNRPTSQTTA